jgi:selenide, water dikinase
MSLRAPQVPPVTVLAVTVSAEVRLTQYAAGGGCACKIPPGELERMVTALGPASHADLLIGLEHGDDAAVVRIRDGQAVVATADFFGPVVDDAYTFGRIAGTNALSDVYAVGGEPLVAVNLLGWPRGKLPVELAGEVLRGGLAEEDLLLLADAQTSGGLLLAGEIPGAPVIGELVPAGADTLILR